MTQTPRDWQKDMERVQQAKHGRTLCNAPVINLAWQDGLPDPWEDVAGYWLQEANIYKQSYEGTLTAYTTVKARADAAEEEARYQKGVTEDYAKGYRLQELRAIAAEAREQRMKEAIEWIQENFEKEWTYEPGTGEVVEEIMQRLDMALNPTLYPDTPAPKEGSS